MTTEQQSILEQISSLADTGSDYDKVETQARQLLAEPYTSESMELHCRSLIVLVKSLWQRGLAKEALPYAEKAIAFAKQIQSKELESKALCNLGNVYRDIADYSKALEYMICALEIDEELGNKLGVAIYATNIGIIYDDLSDYSMALEFYNRARTIYEELGNKEGLAMNIGNIGIVYHNLSKYAVALEYYSRALAIYEEIGSKRGIAATTGNIGGLHIQLTDYQKGLEYVSRSLAMNEELGNKAGVAKDTGNIGNIYGNLSDYPKALEYMNRALFLDEQLGNKQGMAINIGNIGNIHGKREYEGYDPVKAVEYLLKAVGISTEIGNKYHLIFIHKDLADLYEKDNCWEEFAAQYKKYHELYVEVQSDEVANQAQFMEHRRKIEESERNRQVKLARFKEQEKILHNILPIQIANRIIEGEKTIADSYQCVSVFFSDIVAFTNLSRRIEAEELVEMLNGIFTQFDQLARKHGLEKIKTIGDAYMAVAGAPITQENHAERAALFALDVAELMNDYRTRDGDQIQLRIGLHSGSVVAGVIGENKFAYDLWGDAVNTASRMESHGEAGRIHVSSDFVRILNASGEERFKTIPRGEIEIKGKGPMRTFYLQKA